MSEVRLGVVVLSAYQKPRPDRQERGRLLAGRLASDFPTMMETRPNPVSVSSRRAWATLINGRGSLTHGMVVQDDIEPTERFRDNLNAAVEANPGNVLTLFFIRGKVANEAVASGKHWVCTRGGVSAQALVAPLEIADTFLRWEQDWVDPDYPHDDGRWSLWAHFTDNWVWATIPSLVSHDQSLKSSLGHAGRMNVAATLAGASVVDWTQGLADPIIDKTLGWGPVSKVQIERIARGVKPVR